MKSIALLMVVPLAITGCSIIPNLTDSAPALATEPDTEAPDVVALANSVIAEDLVSILAQVDSLQPASSVLWIPSDHPTQGPFPAALAHALQNAGYAIRIGGQIGNAEKVAHSRSTRTDHAEGEARTYTVTIGEVSVRRSYTSTDTGNEAPHGLLPVGELLIRGADASTIITDDSRFTPEYASFQDVPAVQASLATDTSQSPSPAAGNGSQTASPEADNNKATQPTVILAGTEQPVLRQERLQEQSFLDIAAPSTAKQIAKEVDLTVLNDVVSQLSETPTLNIRDLGESNFSELFEDLNIVRETILMFDDDSLRLGETNKTRVQQIVEQFNPASDIFSVIGCSHGSTNLPIGQEGLASGRAARVKDELLYRGIPESKILDEACWAEEAYDNRMPRRGVVLTLKRTIS